MVVISDVQNALFVPINYARKAAIQGAINHYIEGHANAQEIISQMIGYNL